MEKLQREFLLILKSGLTGGKTEVSVTFDSVEALKLAVKHKVESLFYYGIKNSGIYMDPDALDILRERVIALAAKQVRQSNACRELYEKFREKGVSFMPLKGAVMKDMYPKADMRYMGDVDILIKDEEYPIIKEIMTEQGFSFKTESSHEYVWEKEDALYAELHKELVPLYNRDYHAYYENSWSLAKEETENGFVMSDEDFFIYIFTHLANHYRNSGIGIKHFVDIWLYIKEKPDIDKEYIENEIRKLGLIDFIRNVADLLNVWFEGGKETEKTDFMTNWIFSRGAYGNPMNISTSMALRKVNDSGKGAGLKYRLYIRRLFLPYRNMCRQYPILKKAPYLLPFFWVVRITEAVLFKRERIMGEKERIDSLDKDKVEEYKRNLDYVGLEFPEKEE